MADIHTAAAPSWAVEKLKKYAIIFGALGAIVTGMGAIWSFYGTVAAMAESAIETRVDKRLDARVAEMTQEYRNQVEALERRFNGVQETVNAQKGDTREINNKLEALVDQGDERGKRLDLIIQLFGAKPPKD